MKEKREIVIDVQNKDEEKQKICTIPNLLSGLRIVLIPFFIWYYLQGAYLIAVGVIVLSGITDFLDGKIARTYGLITKVGKILDPVADKLTQCAMIFCLAARYPYMIVVIALFVCKEVLMAVMGALLLKRGQMLNGAMWCGKVCTATLYVVLIVLIFFPTIPMAAANLLLFVCIGVMIYSLVEYTSVYLKIFLGKKKLVKD